MGKTEFEKRQRTGMSLVDLTKIFPENETARKWFEEVRWKDGAFCPHCGTSDVQSGIAHKTMTHRCRQCPNKPMFSLKTGTVMAGSKLSYQVWAIAIHLLTNDHNGVSTMKLHRDIKINKKSAWHLAQRLRKSFEAEQNRLSDVVEVDEAKA